MRDREAKGRARHPRGETNGSARLTAALVAEIRRRYAAREANQDQLAAEYGVAQTTISAIVRHETWT